MIIADLRIFLAVASAGSLSAAARQLSVAPMQVSRRLAALEMEVGVRLFHRTTRSVSLTAEGAAFLPYAQTITDADTGARAELSPCPTQATGVLRMTAPSVFGQTVIVPLLPELLEKHPDMRIDLDVSDKLIDIVGEGLDLALRIAPLADSDLVARRLALNPRLLCAAPAYLQRFGEPKTLEELQSHSCILLQSVTRWPFVVNGETHRKRFNGRLITSSVDAVRAAALQGLGVAMLTFWDVVEQLSTGSLVQIDLEDAETEQLSIWAVTPTRRFVPPRVKVFLNALEERLAITAKKCR